MQPAKHHGLTLIELSVTLAVVALLGLSVAPSISGWLGNSQIRNVATSIQAGLQRARAEAVGRNELVRFTLVSLDDSAVMSSSCTAATDGVSWVVSLDAPDGQCEKAVSETSDPRIIEKWAGGVGRKSVKVSSQTVASDGVVAFNGFGRLVKASDGSLAGADTKIDIENLTSGGDFRALRVVVGPGGTTRLCDPKVTDSTDPRKC